MNNIGGAYFETGQYEDALTYFEQALGLRESANNPSDIGETVHNIAETHVRMGRFDRATQNYLRALDLARKSGQARTEAIEAYSLGTVFEYQGRFGAALKSREEAYQRFQTLNDRSFWHAEIQTGYGRSLMLTGESEEARKVLEEGLRVAREKGYQAVLARALNDDGERLRISGDLGGARKRFDEASQVVAGLGDRSLVIRTQINQALLETGDAQRAARTAETLSRLAENADKQGLKYLAIEAALGRVEALLTAGHAPAAAAEAQRALTRADNLGMRMLQARAHYLAGRAGASSGAATAGVRQHFEQTIRLIEDAAREDKAAGMVRRADVAAMLSDSKKAAR